MIYEVVLNEPMNPNGPTTYRVGEKLWGHRDNEDKVKSIRRYAVTGEMAHVQMYEILFENGVKRLVPQHGAMSVQEVPDGD